MILNLVDMNRTPRLKSGIRKRRRESTPPEQLDDDNEHRFQAEEKQAEEHAECDDSSYHWQLRIGRLE
jgi:hypothetical protein